MKGGNQRKKRARATSEALENPYFEGEFWARLNEQSGQAFN